jgi:hypothetical protein
VRYAGQAQQVFEREQQREGPFGAREKAAPVLVQRGHAIGHDHGHAEQDRNDQALVEPAPGASVRL